MRAGSSARTCAMITGSTSTLSALARHYRALEKWEPVVALYEKHASVTGDAARGIDLLLAVDTSRSMLSNDVPPNRLERVKLATQDLINELQGDRVGLIAFAGRAFVQAPLTIDYDAVVEAIHDLDTKTIPEGGTNISEAITLAERTYGKSSV